MFGNLQMIKMLPTLQIWNEEEYSEQQGWILKGHWSRHPKCDWFLKVGKWYSYREKDFANLIRIIIKRK